jgi:hypothetical protein
MAEQNLIEDLRKEVEDFQTFLEAKKVIIKPAIKPLDNLTKGDVSKLITTLIKLLNDLKKEIDKLDPSLVPGLEDVTTFGQDIKTLLEVSRNLLKDTDQTKAIDDALLVVNIIGGLGALTTDVKDAVKESIDVIIGDLTFLKS